MLLCFIYLFFGGKVIFVDKLNFGEILEQMVPFGAIFVFCYAHLNFTLSFKIKANCRVNATILLTRELVLGFTPGYAIFPQITPLGFFFLLPPFCSQTDKFCLAALLSKEKPSGEGHRQSESKDSVQRDIDCETALPKNGKHKSV